ncbi:MAG: multicopper oxidase domain-containing protein [Thermodesulfobacteriota bacterium]
MRTRRGYWQMLLAVSLAAASAAPGQAAPLPGGSLDPQSIPKYVIPLVIPPELPPSSVQPGAPAADYNIAVRQFQQQILPGGIWNTVNGRGDTFAPTTVWSYGRAEDTPPAVAPVPGTTFNYPAFTVEATSGVPTTVRWINGLVDANGGYLPHLLPVDQTLHWANPPQDCIDGTPRTDCRGQSSAPYTGPVPIVTHVHGAHVGPESDGYPEAWWLPAANNIPAGYATQGGFFDQYDRTNAVPGSAYFGYPNDQPATTIWYHDHALGMTRLNVVAGPAGFWLIRGGLYGDAFVLDAASGLPAVLPGPAPVNGAGDPNFDGAHRATIREIPIAIQDRAFNADGSLFYPDNRAFFEGLDPASLNIPFIPDPASDVSPIWNPEVFFNTMVVNGTTWPALEVAPARYRFRLLNGCTARFLNLALILQTPEGGELPFFQIGAEQGFLPAVVRIQTGTSTVYDGTPGGTVVPVPSADQALLMAPAERADVIVDFSALPDGTRVRMINTGPDAPFGGFPADPVADPATTGQVMEFVVRNSLLQPGDATTTAPEDLLLPAEPPLGLAATTRQLSLNEMDSAQVCVTVDPATGAITAVPGDIPPCFSAGAFPFGPREATLGTVMAGGMAMPMMWMDAVTEAPRLGDTEVWELYNLTMDAHPIHLHLVRFETIERQALAVDPATMMPMAMADPMSAPVPALPHEEGFKDTVVAYPGEVTRIKARFDVSGLFVWHCHIVDHEDNEMMRPYVVRRTADINSNGCVDRDDLIALMQAMRSSLPAHARIEYDLNDDGSLDIVDARYLVARFTRPRGQRCAAPAMPVKMR